MPVGSRPREILSDERASRRKSRHITILASAHAEMLGDALRLMACRRKVIAMILLLESHDDNERVAKRGKARGWIRRREEKGYFENIITELTIEDTSGFKEMMRMSKEDFIYVLEQIEQDITPTQVIGGHAVICPKARLALTIRFLATGETYRSLSFQFRISRAAISYIISQVSRAIYRHLGGAYLKVPSTCEEWLAVSKKFEERWNYPNCVGAIDGKHIVIQPPAQCGSLYYNYKHSHSIVLLLVAGADYECIYVDVGTNGRVSDGGVWNKCSLAQKMNDNSLCLPPPKCLPLGKEVPYVLIGDDAFALKPNFMKPYAQAGLTDAGRIYNYRHSRAHRISENVFGILANLWRLIQIMYLVVTRNG